MEKVVLSVLGGVVYPVEIPEGIVVLIKDYDMPDDNEDADDLSEFTEIVFDSSDSEKEED